MFYTWNPHLVINLGLSKTKTSNTRVQQRELKIEENKDKNQTMNLFVVYTLHRHGNLEIVFRNKQRSLQEKGALMNIR